MAGPWENYTPSSGGSVAPGEGPWAQYQQPEAQPEKKKFGLGDTWPARLVKSAIEAAALPGEVAQGKAQVPQSSNMGVESTENIGRVFDLAGVANPINPAVRAGDAIIPGAKNSWTLQQPSEAALPKIAAPSRESLGAAATADFERIKELGVQIKPEATRGLKRVIEAKLQAEGYRKSSAPGVFEGVGEIPKRVGKTATIADIESARKVIQKAGANHTESDAARIARDEIDNFYSGLAENPAVIEGSADKVAEVLGQARGNYAAAKRSDLIMTAEGRAKLNAETSGSGTNIDNTTRQAIKNLLLRKGGAEVRGFSGPEIEQMTTIAKGTVPTNILRGIGKLGPTGGLMGGLHLGAAVTSAGTTIPLSAAAFAARKIADAMTAKQVRKLDEMIRSRSPLYEAGPKSGTGGTNPKVAAVVSALLSRSPLRPKLHITSQPQEATY